MKEILFKCKKKNSMPWAAWLNFHQKSIPSQNVQTPPQLQTKSASTTFWKIHSGLKVTDLRRCICFWVMTDFGFWESVGLILQYRKRRNFGAKKNREFHQKSNYFGWFFLSKFSAFKTSAEFKFQQKTLERFLKWLLCECQASEKFLRVSNKCSFWWWPW